MLRRVKIFAFGRGNALSVLEPVLVAEDAEVNIAVLDFCQVNLIGSLITGGQFFKQENFGDEPSQERVA
jgi:hypothetical protein